MAESESTIKVCIKTAQKQKYDNSSSMGTVKVVSCLFYIRAWMDL